MKKIFCLFASMLLLFSVSALAEDVDYSSMDIDELIEIRGMVETEIEERLRIEDYEMIPEGYHFVGKDIAPGVYELKMDEDAGGSYRIYVFDNETARDEYIRADSEYEAAEIEWDALYEAGKVDEDTKPDIPDPEDYSSSYVFLADSDIKKLELEEGQILWITDFLADTPLYIRPWTGLFMD